LREPALPERMREEWLLDAGAKRGILVETGKRE
jgi:hypothetical protein